MMLPRWFSRSRQTSPASRRARSAQSRRSLQRIQCAVEAMEMRVLLSSTISFDPAINVTGLAFAPDSIAAADFRGDGKEDLVIGNGVYDGVGPNSVSVLLGNGNGTFVTPANANSPQYLSTGTGGGEPYFVATADLNGDGNQDIVALNGNSTVSIMLGNGDGTFKPAIVIPDNANSPSALAIGDFNGHPDIALVDTLTAKIQVILLNGANSFNSDGTLKPLGTGYTIKTLSTYGSFPYSVSAGDFNGDAGLAVLNILSENVSVQISDNDGNFTPTSSEPTGGLHKKHVIVTQIDGDGPPEIIVGGYKSLSATLGNNDGSFQSPITLYSQQAFVFGAAVADFAGANVPDVVALDITPDSPDEGAVAVYSGLNIGVLTKSATINVPDVGIGPNRSNSVSAVDAVDLTGDGEPDLVVATSARTISVFLNNNSSYTAPVITSAPVFVSAPVVTFTAGVPNSFNIDAAGTTTPVLSLTSGNLPAGLSFVPGGNGTATLSGTPGMTTGGVYHLSLKATNGVNPAGTQSFTLTVLQSPVFPPIFSPQTLTVGDAGTLTFTTTAYPTAAISESPSNVELPTGLTFIDLGNGTATLSGTPAPGTGGTYSFTETADNGATTPQEQSFTLEIEQAPTISSADNAAVTIGTFGSFTVTTTGFPAATFTETGALPTGVTFNDGTGVLSGTAVGPANTTYVITIGASNVVNSGSPVNQVFTLTVDQSPSFSSLASATFTAGAPKIFNISAVSFPVGTVTESGALPAGLTFQAAANGSATLSGTPAANSGGIYNLTLTASNGLGVATQNFTLTVDQSLSFANAPNTQFAAAMPGNFVLGVSGFPVATISEAGDLPTGVSFLDNGNGTATLAGTPMAGSQGIYKVSVTAANGISRVIQETFTLTVGTYAAPAITSVNPPAFTTGKAATYKLTTTGFPSAVLSVAGGTIPAGLTFTDFGNGSATLAGTPAQGTGGISSLSFVATNSASGTATKAFTLTVDQASQFTSADSTSLTAVVPAITSSPTTTFDVSALRTFTVSTTGFAPAPTLTEIGALPSGLSFHDYGNGTATLAGTAASASAGAYPLTLIARNSTATTTQAFTLTVPAPAITSPATTSFTAGTPDTFTVSTTGFPPAPTLTETGALPTGVTFMDNGNGTATLAGTAASASEGAYNLTLKAINGVATTTQAFTLTVQALSFTSGDTADFALSLPSTFTVTTAGLPAVALSDNFGVLPSGVSFMDNGNGTATLSGTPEQSGTFNFTLTAANGEPSGTLSENFSIFVESPVAPTITSAAGESVPAGAFTFTLTTDGFPTAMLSQTGAPGGLTFTDNQNGTGTLSGTVAAGAYVLTFTAANGTAPAATQTFNLTVENPVAPAITSAAGESVPAGPFTFTVTTTASPTAMLSQTGAPGGLTFTDNQNGTATLAGNAAVGSYSLTFTAANGTAPAATQTFTLLVDDFLITTSGFPTATLSKSGTLPAGVTFTPGANGTATISGVPAATSGGTYKLILTAANHVTPNVTQTFTLTVDQAPAISAASATFTIGKNQRILIPATGFPHPSVTLTDASDLNASGLDLQDNGNGSAELFGTPAAGSGGTYVLTLSAANGAATITKLFTLTIDQPPALTSASSITLTSVSPAITSPATTTFTVGAPGTLAVSTTGFAAAPTLTEIGALPSGVTFTPGANGTAILAGTAASASEGSYHLTLTAGNGVTATTQAFTLDVQALAITSADDVDFAEGTVGLFTVATAGAPFATLSETGDLPPGVTLTPNSNGTATLEGAAGETGEFVFTLTATNSEMGGTAVQVFTLTAENTSVPAFTSASSESAVPGPETFAVTTSGFPSATLTESGALPGGLTFTDNHDGTGTLAGNPAAGTYMFTFTAANGVTPNAVQPFTLVVSPPSNSLAITSTGFPSPTLSEKGALPPGVSLSTANGVTTLGSAPTVGGTYHITLMATNGVGTAATQPFTLTVDQAPSFTSASTASFKAGVSGAFTITTADFPLATLTESGALPTGVTFHDNGNGTAKLSGTPAAGAGQTYVLTFSATSGLGSASQNFTLTVDQPLAFTTNNILAFTQNVTRTYSFQTTGFPLASFIETGIVPGMTFIDHSNGAASLAGAPSTPGTYGLTLTAGNGTGNTAVQKCTVYVTPATIMSAITSPAASDVVQDSSQPPPTTPPPAAGSSTIGGILLSPDPGLTMVPINLPDGGSATLLPPDSLGLS